MADDHVVFAAFFTNEIGDAICELWKEIVNSVFLRSHRTGFQMYHTSSRRKIDDLWI